MRVITLALTTADAEKMEKMCCEELSNKLMEAPYSAKHDDGIKSLLHILMHLNAEQYENFKNEYEEAKKSWK